MSTGEVDRFPQSVEPVLFRVLEHIYVIQEAKSRRYACEWMPANAVLAVQAWRGLV